MSKLWMYHLSEPAGVIVDSEQVDQLKSEGWVNSPALLDLPKQSEKVKIDLDQAKNARPEDLVGMVRSMGFTVLTDVELEVMKNKASFTATPLTIESFSDEELINEAERRGLKSAEDDHEQSKENELQLLQDMFNEEPESLTISELVTLGNDKFKLGLRSNMKEATLIEKINVAMNGAD